MRHSEEKMRKTSIKKNMEVFEEFDLIPNQKMFLAAYAELGNITQAAHIAGISRRNHHRWMKPGEFGYRKDYPRAFEEAKEMAVERLEEEVHRRAIEGVEKGVYFRGEKIATERWYSDNLLMFRLKALAPEKYREKTEHTHRVDGQIDMINRIAGLSDEELRQLAVAPIKNEAEDESVILDIEKEN